VEGSVLSELVLGQLRVRKMDCTIATAKAPLATGQQA